MRELGVLVDVDVHGTSMFTARATWNELGIPEEDTRRKRLKRGTKDLIPKVYIGRLRPELIRRFSEVFFVDLPTETERAEILSIHLQKRGRDAQAFDVAKVAAETAEFTGSEMEKVVQAGPRRAFARGEDLTTEHLVEVARTMVPPATTMSAGIAQMREWAARTRPTSSRQQTGRKVGSGARALMM
jgi:hypothetical protein